MKKKVLLVPALVWLVVTFFIIRVTYAKYLSTLNSSADIDISGWKIVLNTQDITQNSNFSQNVSLVFPGDNYYTENVIVPGAMRIF